MTRIYSFDVYVMAPGGATHWQKTPCTRQAWSWVTFSEIHEAEVRMVIAIPIGLGTAWPLWPDPDDSKWCMGLCGRGRK